MHNNNYISADLEGVVHVVGHVGPNTYVELYTMQHNTALQYVL